MKCTAICFPILDVVDSAAPFFRPGFFVAANDGQAFDCPFAEFRVWVVGIFFQFGAGSD